MGQSMVTGTWSGLLNIGSARLRMKLTIGDDGAATLYSIDQCGKPIPDGWQRNEWKSNFRLFPGVLLGDWFPIGVKT
jgi:hypothetical protein